MTKLITAKAMVEEWRVLKAAAIRDRPKDKSLSRWLIELGLARAAELGIKRAAKLQESPSSD